jgi:hypothetical protein
LALTSPRLGNNLLQFVISYLHLIGCTARVNLYLEGVGAMSRRQGAHRPGRPDMTANTTSVRFWTGPDTIEFGGSLEYLGSVGIPWDAVTGLTDGDLAFAARCAFGEAPADTVTYALVGSDLRVL